MKRVIVWLERDEQRIEPLWVTAVIGIGGCIAPIALLFLGYGLGIK